MCSRFSAGKTIKTTPNLRMKARILPLKQYDVTLTGHYEKTISVYADSPEQAAEKLKIILFDTDLIDFSDEDFVCGEADIAEADEDGEKEIDPSDDEEDECLKHEDCSECPYFCPMCGECRLEDED